jgi:putative tricarboxylic transport membrane protein
MRFAGKKAQQETSWVCPMSDPKHPKLRLNNAELWSGAVGLALAVFVTWQGLKLGIGSIHDPGSGYVLFYTGLLMVLFSLAIMIAGVTEGGATLGSLWAGTRWTKPLTVIACLAAFAVLLEPLGFLLAAIPLMLLLLRVIDPVRWTLALPLAVLAPLVAWWVLKHALAIQLPAGMFDIG